MGRQRRGVPPLRRANTVGKCEAVSRLESLCSGGHKVNLKTIGHLFSESFTKWDDDDAQRMGAALAFYTVLSMSPLVIFVISIVSLVLSRSSAQSLLMAQVQSLIGSSGRDAIAMMLANSQRHGQGLFSSLLGFITLIFGASGVFGELRSALNKIWKTKPKAASSLTVMARERLFAFGMVVSVGFVLLVSLIGSTVLAATTKYFSGVLPFPAIFWEALNFLVSFAGVTVLFALILEVCSGDEGRVGRRTCGRCVYRAAFCPGQAVACPLSWAGQPGIILRGGGIAGGGSGLGLLLRPNLLFRRRVNPCLRDVPPPRGAGRGLSVRCCGLSATC